MTPQDKIKNIMYDQSNEGTGLFGVDKAFQTHINNYAVVHAQSLRSKELADNKIFRY